MAKRLQSIDTWEKDWFINLEDHYKLFYQYIEDHCSEAGIWAPQKASFERMLSQRKQIDYYKFIEQINADNTQRIVILKNGNWLLVNYFSDRQGAEVKVTNGFHRKVIRDLIIHEALGEIQGIMNIEESIANYHQWTQKRKEAAKEKLMSTASLMSPHENFKTEDFISRNEVEIITGEIEEKKIKLKGRAETFHFPEITLLSDGSAQVVEIEKFLRNAPFEMFCRLEKITDATKFKNILEDFIKKVITDYNSVDKPKGASQIQTWFTNWYTKSKDNYKYKEGTIESRKTIPKPRQAGEHPS